jgi:anti-sigma-K factor RskA
VRFLPRSPRGSGGPGDGELHELAAAYALDALDDMERARFERHLQACPECAAELRGFAATATMMANATAAEPPTALKARVLAGVAVTRQLPPEVATAGGGSRDGAVADSGAPGIGRRRGGRGATRPSGLVPKISAGIAAASLAAAAALAIVTVNTHDELSTAQEHNAALAAVLAAPDARIVTGGTTAGGTATVVASLRRGEMVFTSAGLPALPASQVYQLWFLGAGSPRSAGLVPAAGSSGSTAPVLASGLAAGDKIGVTVEPAGGTSAPTTTPIVVLPVSA